MAAVRTARPHAGPAGKNSEAPRPGGAEGFQANVVVCHYTDDGRAVTQPGVTGSISNHEQPLVEPQLGHL